MKNIFSSFQEAFNERLGSPLYVKFLISFLIINYQITIALIYGDENFTERTIFLKQYFETTSYTYIIIYPLISTILFIVCFPFFNNLSLYAREFWRKKAREIIEKYELQKKLTIEQSLKLKNKIKYLEEENQKLVSEYSNMISVLETSQAEELEEFEEFEEQNDDKKSFMSDLTPSKELAKIIGSQPMPRTEVVKKIWDYIKKNNLQDAKNRRNINADENLINIFQGKKVVSMFELTKYISRHLS